MFAGVCCLLMSLSDVVRFLLIVTTDCSLMFAR